MLFCHILLYVFEWSSQCLSWNFPSGLLNNLNKTICFGLIPLNFNRIQKFCSYIVLLPPVKVKVAQSCPALCNPMDYTVWLYSPWNSPGQILEWEIFPFSRESSQLRGRTQVSHIAGSSTLCYYHKITIYILHTRKSVQFSRSVVSDSLRPHESQHARPPSASPTPGVYSNSCPSSWWCHPAISSSVILFSSCPQSLPASRSFRMSQLLAWGDQIIGVSASTSVLPMKTQDWSPSGWTSWISWQSKGLSRVFSNITVQKHQFFGAQLS